MILNSSFIDACCTLDLEVCYQIKLFSPECRARKQQGLPNLRRQQHLLMEARQTITRHPCPVSSFQLG